VLARNLAPGLGAQPGAVHLSTDAERKSDAGVALASRLGEPSYAPAARSGVYDRLIERASAILQAGHSVILDGTFLDARDRDAVNGLGRRLGLPVRGVWLEAPADMLIARVESRHGDASDANVAVVQAQLATDPGEVGWSRIDATGSPLQVAAAARAALSGQEMPNPAAPPGSRV
jgi:predicted kinase